MTDANSYAEFVLGLFAAQFKDCTALYPALAKEFERDLARLRSAVDCHGIRFALDTMPAWRKHFDMCLATQRLTPSHTNNFGTLKGGIVPRFLRGLVLRVFDLNGILKPDPDKQAIRCIRQLLGVARKLRVDCKPKARSDAVREFVRTDLETRLPDLDWSGKTSFVECGTSGVSMVDIVPSSDSSKQMVLPIFPEVPSLNFRHAECIQQVADFISSCLGEYLPAETRFRHGPGAVADRGFGTHKYEFHSWPARLDRVFPMADFACANYADWFDSSLYRSSERDTHREYPAKLCAVPKTLSTPRLIASEPTSLQWCQQSIRDFLYTRVTRSVLHNFVEFARQDVNGNLALEASHSQSHCTIDLSSASDRISCWHVERLFRQCPTLLDACVASRSAFIRQDICRKTPEFIRLRKYSTMGNATTFPVQSLFFLAIVLGSVLYAREKRVCAREIWALGRDEVRVFGDDLIVPTDCVGATIDALIALGLKVNEAKTFVTGRFRESCGVDAYDGDNVTTVSVLDVPRQAKPGSIVSSVDVHNNLCSRDWLWSSSFIRKTVEASRFRWIREVTHGSGSFGWYPNYIDEALPLKSRWNPDLQIREVRCLVQSVKTRVRPSEGSAALLQFFTEAAKIVERRSSSLHYPLQRAKSSLRLGWVPVG